MSDDFNRIYQYIGRNCYTPTGVSSYCTVVDSTFHTGSRGILLVTNQDRYYDDGITPYQIGMLGTADDTSKITYKNGNATVPGKFIVVAHSFDSSAPADEQYI